MGGLNSEEESNQLFMNMQKIKTFLQIKGRKLLLKSIYSLEKLQNDLKTRFIALQDHLSVLEKQKNDLLVINEDINSQIMGRINNIAQETKNIQIERVKSKDEIFLVIEKELKCMQDNATEERKQLETQLGEIKVQNKVLNVQLANYAEKATEKRVFVDKGVQLQIENLIEAKDTDDINIFHKNLRMFVAEGKIQSSEWALALITDISSCKLIADYRDYKSK